jgi:hypothetical protein
VDEHELRRLLRDQDDVVSWRQLRDVAGLASHDVERLLRRRDLVRVHPRVYVGHTGPLSWRQRAWAAVLYAEPAALCLGSALPEPDERAPIEVAIEGDRRLEPRPGLRIHRMQDLEAKVRWNLSPPRLRPEQAALDLVDRASSELDVVAVLSRVIGGRATTAGLLRATLDGRPRLRRRRWVTRLLDDLELGVCSVLEHAYLVRVERPHGLPRSRRQAPRRPDGRWEYRDAEYEDHGLVVELDGRLGHESWADGGVDADRDLDDAADGRLAVRLRWRQVVGTPCRTAERVARILRHRGWTGRARACGPDCDVTG